MIKKFIKTSISILTTMWLLLVISVPALAAGGFDAKKDLGHLGNKDKNSHAIDLPSFDTGGQHADAPVEEGVSQIGSVGLFLIDAMKYIIGTIAFAMIIFASVRLITAGKEIEDVVTKSKDHIKYSVIALIMVFLAEPLVRQVFFGATGEVFSSETYAQQFATTGSSVILSVIRFAEAFAAVVAVLMIVFSGVIIVAGGGEEETRNKHVKRIMYAVGGLILVGLSELLVLGILFPNKGSALPNLVAARNTILNLVNFATGFIAFLSIAVAIYGGYLYVFGGANEEFTQKAKKVLFGAVIGILIAISAFAIANTLIPPAEDIPEELGQPLEGEL